MPKYLWVFLIRSNLPVLCPHSTTGRRLFSFCLKSGRLTQQCLLPFSHYSIVRAWTAVPLFIESDGTTLHLNPPHHGRVPGMKLYLLSFLQSGLQEHGSQSGCRCLHLYGFTTITLLNSDFSAKFKTNKNENLLFWIGSAMQYWSSSYDVYVRFIASREQCYIWSFFVVCLFF